MEYNSKSRTQEFLEPGHDFLRPKIYDLILILNPTEIYFPYIGNRWIDRLGNRGGTVYRAKYEGLGFLEKEAARIVGENDFDSWRSENNYYIIWENPNPDVFPVTVSREVYRPYTQLQTSTFQNYSDFEENVEMNVNPSDWHYFFTDYSTRFPNWVWLPHPNLINVFVDKSVEKINRNINKNVVLKLDQVRGIEGILEKHYESIK